MNDFDDLPDVDVPEVKKHEVSDKFPYAVAFHMGFVGLGQGGGRIAETFFKLGYGRVGVINSAHEDLKDIDDAIEKLDMGKGGAGQDMAKGAAYVKQHEEDIWNLLTRAIGEDPDYLLCCASLGGGTGSGGVSRLIRIARRYMEEIGKPAERVGVIVSLPQAYEGQRTCRNAVQAFKEVAAEAPTPFFIIDNKRIEERYRVGALGKFATCNNQIAKLFHLFNRLAAQRSQLLTFDRADYAALLDSGIIVFGASPIAKYESKADIAECVRQQLEQTVLAQVDLSRGKKAGCIFLGGESILQQVPMDFFGGGFSSLGRLLADDSTIYRGVYVGNSNDLRCYTMIAELPPPVERLTELAKQARLSSDSGGTAEHFGIDG